ncbi:MAG TPA: helix-turn-helix domain-containing protein [Allocoleopsis sp.]
MKAIPLVRVSSMLPVVKFLNQIGAPTERLLQQAKLSSLVLDNPNNLVPLYSSFAFAELAARTEGLEHLTILVSQQTQVAEMGQFGKLLCQSLTLYDLLNRVVSNVTCNNSGARAWIDERGDQIWLHQQFINAAKVEDQQAQYFACLMYLKIIQLVTGANWYPSALCVQANALKGVTKLEPFSGTKVFFNQPSNAIALPKSLLSMPLQPTLNFTSSEQEHETWQASAPVPDFTGSLRQLIRALLQTGSPDIDQAATAAGMSVRSFQRRLTEENLNYSRLVDQVRFEAATSWLQDPSIQIIDIALELGYTDASNFTRAFKRWTGISPREFRRLHKK